jgi:hypothetical protein
MSITLRPDAKTLSKVSENSAEPTIAPAEQSTKTQETTAKKLLRDSFDRELKQPEVKPQGPLSAEKADEPAELMALLPMIVALPLGAKPKGAVAAEDTVALKGEDLLANEPFTSGDVVALHELADALQQGLIKLDPALSEAIKALAAMASSAFEAPNEDKLPKDLDPQLVRTLRAALDKLGSNLKDLGSGKKAEQALEAQLHGNAKLSVEQLQKIFGPLPTQVLKQMLKLSPRTLSLLASLQRTNVKHADKKPDAKAEAPTRDKTQEDDFESAIAALPPITLPRYDIPEEARAGMEDLLTRMMANGGDIEQLMMVVMFNSSRFATDELKDALAQMQEMNAKKQRQREFIGQMREQRAKMESDLRARYDERVQRGEIDPAQFSFDDFKESQRFNVLSADGSGLPGTDASEAGDFEFAVGDDVPVPGGKEPRRDTVSTKAVIPNGISEETFAARLHLTVEDLHQLMALYDGTPDDVLKAVMGPPVQNGRISFVDWLMRPQSAGGVGLDALENGPSQSEKAQSFLQRYPAEVDKAAAKLQAQNDHLAARDAERSRIAQQYGLSVEQVIKLQLDYTRFDHKYATFDAYLAGEVKLSKIDVARNAQLVATRFDTSERDAKNTGFAKLAQFAEDFGLSKGMALALFDVFRKMKNIEATNFSAVPVELLRFLEQEVDGFGGESNVAANAAAVDGWLQAQAAGPAELTGSPEYFALLAKVAGPAIDNDGNWRDSNSESYRTKAKSVSKEIKAFGDAHLGDTRAEIDDQLLVLFQHLMMEAFFTKQQDNQGKRDWYHPSTLMDDLTSFIKGLPPEMKGFACDYVELRVAEFQRDLTASMSSGARGALDEAFGNAVAGGAAAGGATAVALASTGGGILFIPAAVPIAATFGAINGAFEVFGNDMFSAFIPENQFGNDGSHHWELFDEDERKEYNPDNKDNTDWGRDKSTKKQYGMGWAERPNDDTLGIVLGFLSRGDYFGSSLVVVDGAPGVGFEHGGRESRVVDGQDTTSLRNEVFEGNAAIEQEARAAAAARAYSEVGEAYGSAADRRAMGGSTSATGSSRDFNRDGKVDAGDIALADKAVQQAEQSGDPALIKKAKKDRAIIGAKIEIERRAVEANENARTRELQKQTYLLKPEVSQAPASVSEEASAGGQSASRQITLGELDAKIEGWQDGLDSLSELGEEQSLRLQLLMDRVSQIKGMITNMMKKLFDTSQTMTANLK